VNNYTSDTVSNYISCIQQFRTYINDIYGIDPRLITGTHLKAWFKHIKQTGVSHSRLIHHQSAIKHFYSFLRNMNCINTNPTFALLPIRRGKRNRRQAIDTNTAIRLLNAVDRSTWFGERDFLIMSCLWALGIRRQEAAALTRGCFEPDIVPGQNIALLRVHGKGDKERALFVVDQLYEHFVRYLNHPKTPTGEDDPMFKSKTGTFMHGDAIGKIVSKYTKLAGIEQHITPHMLRHGFATEMYLQGVPPEAIQAMMGHDKLEETATYIHIPMQSKKQALELLTINGDQHGC
jgi:integrase/recombinase XerD